MTTTVIFDITNNNESYKLGSSVLIGQTATLPFDLPVGSLVDFEATVGASNGSLAEQASVYSYNSTTNAVGPLLGTSLQVTSSGVSLTDFDIMLNQGASGQIAIVISTNGTTNQDFTVARSSGENYSGGTMIQSNDGGTTYIDLSAYDFGELSVTPADVSAVPEPSSAVLMGAVLVAGAAVAAVRSKFTSRFKSPKFAA